MPVKLTKEEFIRRAQEIHKDEFGNPLYDYSKVEYVNSYTKVKIYCNTCNKFFVQTPNAHLCGHGCSKCGTRNGCEHRDNKLDERKQNFIKKSISVHGEGRYNYDKVEYINNSTKVLIHCNVCGNDFEQVPNSHTQGCGCPACSIKRTHDQQKLGKNEFIRRAKLKYGNKYNYNEVEYVDYYTKVRIRCNICQKVFEQSPQVHLMGDRKNKCPDCAKRAILESRTLDTTEFVQKAKLVHGEDRYNYDKVDYKKSSEKVLIHCNVCGKEFAQTPNSHLGGSGCPVCGAKKQNDSQRMGKDEFIRRAQLVHGKEKYNYDQVEYINNRTKIRIYCNSCHKLFEQDPQAHLKGSGCPSCYRFAGEDMIMSWLDKMNIKYEIQYLVKEIKKTSKSIEVDFRLFYNDQEIWIEYNGKQHYEFINFFHNGSLDEFEIQKDRDLREKQFCITNNIKLIEVPYIFNTKETIYDFLDKTIIQGVDPNLLVDYSSLYK